MYNSMKVKKRNGNSEEVSFDKILKRLKALCTGEEFTKKLSIDPTKYVLKSMITLKHPS